MLAGLGRAGADLPPEAGVLDLRSLAGLSVDAAIDAIVDAFMPPGILDEVAARLSMEQALATALGGADEFNPAALDANAVQVATRAFVAELVFVEVAGDAGKSLMAIGPVAAAQREADIRSLVREVVDLVGTPLIQAAGTTLLTGQAMSALVTRLVQETLTEVDSWR